MLYVANFRRNFNESNFKENLKKGFENLAIKMSFQK